MARIRAWVHEVAAGGRIVSHSTEVAPNTPTTPRGVPALDPPTRLAEGKPSRKNRPPFHGKEKNYGDDSATTTTTSGSVGPTVSRHYHHHRRHTTIVIASATVTGPLPPPTHRDQPSSRGTRIPELTDLRVALLFAGSRGTSARSSLGSDRSRPSRP